jgi:hypothetical protein
MTVFVVAVVFIDILLLLLNDTQRSEARKNYIPPFLGRESQKGAPKLFL